MTIAQRARRTRTPARSELDGPKIPNHAVTDFAERHWVEFMTTTRGIDGGDCPDLRDPERDISSVVLEDLPVRLFESVSREAGAKDLTSGAIQASPQDIAPEPFAVLGANFHPIDSNWSGACIRHGDLDHPVVVRLRMIGEPLLHATQRDYGLGSRSDFDPNPRASATAQRGVAPTENGQDPSRKFDHLARPERRLSHKVYRTNRCVVASPAAREIGHRTRTTGTAEAPSSETRARWREGAVNP